MSKRDPLNAKVPMYNTEWHPQMTPLMREMIMVQNGGEWKKSNGKDVVGNGLAFHFKALIKQIWPWVVWHDWLERFVDNYIAHRSMVVFGAAWTGKSFDAGLCALADYYPFPYTTTTLVCSTTKELLESKIWGEIKRLHNDAQNRHPFLPGHLIEGRLRIITDDKSLVSEGRDFRNGLCGVPAKRGDNFSGLGEFSGIHNKRVRLFGDELHLLPKVFVDGISNLDKAPDFKVVGLANPKETTDAAGILGEPCADLGFWDGGIDQTGGTKVWKTRRPNGCALQFVGTDSPNWNGDLGIPLITKEAYDRDLAFFGKDSWQFTMMNEGRMPRGQGSRRVITRQECIQHHAMEEPIWLNSNLTHMAGLDAAYGGVGGDRCILTFLDFGQEITPLDPSAIIASSFVDQPMPSDKRHQIMALADQILVPVDSKVNKPPTDQIVEFCKAECEKRGVSPQNLFYEAGMRTALVQRFGELWPGTQTIDFGGPASADRNVSADIDVICKDYYSKYVTELWFAFRLIVISNQFRNLRDDVMMEFCQREWGMVGANRIEIETKKLMKARMGFSPDRADSLVTVIEGARRKGFIIRNLAKSSRNDEKDNRWKDDLEKKARAFWRAGQLIEA